MTWTNVFTSLMFSELLIVSEEAIAMREKSILSSAGEIKVLLHHFSSEIHSRWWGKMENTQKVFFVLRAGCGLRIWMGLKFSSSLALSLKSRDDENMKTAGKNIIKLKNDSMSFSLENFIAHTSVFSATDDVCERAKKRLFFVNEIASEKCWICHHRSHETASSNPATSSMRKSRGRWSRATAEHSRIFLFVFIFFLLLVSSEFYDDLYCEEVRDDETSTCFSPSHKDSFFYNKIIDELYD